MIEFCRSIMICFFLTYLLVVPHAVVIKYGLCGRYYSNVTTLLFSGDDKVSG